MTFAQHMLNAHTVTWLPIYTYNQNNSSPTKFLLGYICMWEAAFWKICMQRALWKKVKKPLDILIVTCACRDSTSTERTNIYSSLNHNIKYKIFTNSSHPSNLYYVHIYVCVYFENVNQTNTYAKYNSSLLIKTFASAGKRRIFAI